MQTSLVGFLGAAAFLVLGVFLDAVLGIEVRQDFLSARKSPLGLGLVLLAASVTILIVATVRACFARR